MKKKKAKSARKPANGKAAQSTPKKTKKAQFLEAFGDCGVVRYAADDAGIHRSTVYKWVADDPAFARDYESAQSDALEMLEREAIRRAFVGVDEPIFQNGKLVGQKRKYSDTLMIFLLKAISPDKYRERYEHKVTADVTRKVIYMPDNGRMQGDDNDK